MNIDQFLNQAGELGSFDSEGVFTIAEAEAIKKLAAFQLPHPECWIVKILQAAVVSGATRFEVSVGPQSTFFRYDPVELFEMDSLAKALVSSEMSPSRVLRHLAIGLRAAGFAGGRQFTFAFEQGPERLLLGWDGAKLAQGRQSVDSPGEGPRVTLGVSHARDLKDSSRLELKELEQRAEACPVKVLVNGRRIDTLRAPLFDPGHGLGRRVVLSVGRCRGPSADDPPPVSVPRGLRTKRGRLGGDRFMGTDILHISRDCLSGEAVSGLCKLSYGFHIDSHRSTTGRFRWVSKPRHSYIHWVVDGVVCDRHRWGFDPSAVAFDLYLSGQGLPTDVSGFQIIRRPDVAQRISKVLPSVGAQAQRVAHLIRQRFPRPFGYHGAVAAAFTAVAVFVPSVFLVQLVAGGVAAANLGLSLVDKRELMEDAARYLQRLSEEIPQ